MDPPAAAGERRPAGRGPAPGASASAAAPAAAERDGEPAGEERPAELPVLRPAALPLLGSPAPDDPEPEVWVEAEEAGEPEEAEDCAAAAEDCAAAAEEAGADGAAAPAAAAAAEAAEADDGGADCAAAAEESAGEPPQPGGREPRVLEKTRGPRMKAAPGGYKVPVEGLLKAYPDADYWKVDEETRQASEVLMATLEEFKIQAEVTGIRKGPVITMFEILPSPGVKISRIVNLADNIALRLAASRVRIVAPIPGKHAVGIEVPNKNRAIVSFKEIIELEDFKKHSGGIPVILGKDITGEAQIIDLTQTPAPADRRGHRLRASRCASTRSSAPSSTAAPPTRCASCWWTPRSWS